MVYHCYNCRRSLFLFFSSEIQRIKKEELYSKKYVQITY